MTETVKSKAEKSDRKKTRMVIFRGSEALPVSDEMMPAVPVGPDVQAKMLPLMESGIMDGSDVRCLFRDQASGMSLVYVWFKGGYVLPRHSHSADVTRNDAAMWARVLAGVTANKDKWQNQTKPPQRH